MVLQVVRPVSQHFLDETEERLLQDFKRLTGRAITPRTVSIITQGEDKLLTQKVGETATSVTYLLSLGEREIGLLALASPRPTALKADSLKLSTVVSRQVAVAIENAYLFERTRRHLEVNEILVSLSQEMSQTLQLDRLLHLIVGSPLRVIPHSRSCTLHLLDEERERLIAVAYQGPELSDNQKESDGMPIGQGIAGLSFQNQETVYLDDILGDPRFLELNPERSFRSLLVTPLVTRGQALGTISIMGEAVGTFTPQDIHLMESLAAHAAVVIENSRLYREILSEERRMEAIIANMVDGVIMLDDQNRIRTLNPVAERLLGIREQDILGQKVTCDSQDPYLQRLDVLCRYQPTSFPSKLHNTTNQDSELLSARSWEVLVGPAMDRVLHVYSSPLQDELGLSRGQVLVLHDVTRERELDRLKDEFVDRVSHELRTPLFSIQGFVNLILKGKVLDPDVQQEFLTRVADQANRLSAVVDDLLNVSRIEAGQFELERERVHIQSIAERIVGQLENMAREKSISLVVHSNTLLPTVEADPRRIEQVLVNLVGNALKFTPLEGRIAVTTAIEGEELLVQVSDTGMGIPPEAIPNLFSKFFQVDGSATRRVGGTGLGLYISKLIIEAHGGRIWAESQQGKGSTFSFSLPVGDNR